MLRYGVHEFREDRVLWRTSWTRWWGLLHWVRY